MRLEGRKAQTSRGIELALTVDPTSRNGPGSMVWQDGKVHSSGAGGVEPGITHKENNELVVLNSAGTLNVHKPQSQEDCLAMMVMETLAREQAEDTWYRHVPQMLYRDPLVAVCFKPTCLASRYRNQASRFRATEAIYTVMGEALRAIQLALGSSPHTGGTGYFSCFLAISGLSCFESLMGDRGFGAPDHMDGMLAVLAACGVIPRATTSCMRGEISPLEKLGGGIVSCLEASMSGKAESILDLKSTANALCCRIPRLIWAVRRHFTQEDRLGWGLAHARHLVKELLRYTAESSENAVLHDVHIVRVVHSTDSLVSRYAMFYHDYWRFEALVRYWTARLTIIRVSLRLQSVSTTKNNLDIDARQILCKQATYLVRQLLMSHGYARKISTPSRRRLWAHALGTVWGALADFAFAAEEKTAFLRSWVLQEVNLTLTPSIRFSRYDLDHAAELMVGGPLGGSYARLYTRKK
ncbi:hypothetical protein LTR97_004132 [Elasticomyces elasticus]|uniref:Uncharacterized protein n=1 Tax=Elasticomyces elasticus TaxID=574655 RepID=A0AAN7WDG0_9PEZI|nr:hypothetical protein LTR97_004132 [Elasticomyces elasticus]